jgi:hypothetical protein
MCATAHISDSEHASLCPTIRMRAVPKRHLTSRRRKNQTSERRCARHSHRQLPASSRSSSGSDAAPCKLSGGYAKRGVKRAEH